MNADERALTQLREFRAGLAEPSHDRLARMRFRLDDHAEQPTRQPRRTPGRGRLVPALAAAAVLAVAAGATVVGLRSPSEADRAAAAQHHNAVELLDRFADAAGSGPAPITVPPGKVLYIKSWVAQARLKTPSETNHLEIPDNGPDGKPSVIRQTFDYESWVDVNGSIALMGRPIKDPNANEFVVVPDPITTPGYDEIIAEQRAALAQHGPSLGRTTPEFIAGLPTDPDAMLALLRTFTRDQLANQRHPGTPESPVDEAIIGRLYWSLLGSGEPLIPPLVRASLYRALANLDSVTSTGEQIEINGRTVYAIGQLDRGSRYELLLDATTGRVVGSRQFHGDSRLDPSVTELWAFAVVDKLGDKP